MIVVIQCSATKRADVGFLKTKDGKPVSFVTKPEMASRDESCVYARPDDLSDDCEMMSAIKYYSDRFAFPVDAWS